jgi:TPP-dependent trihydroxycyclohexane-1,2-dione (THcHDO) dehydratase
MADMQHSFTVVAEGSARDIELALSSDVLGSLADVPVSFVMGRMHADFERPAATLEDAVSTAVEDIRRLGLKVLRVHS